MSNNNQRPGTSNIGRIIYAVASRVVPRPEVNDQVVVVAETCTDEVGRKVSGNFAQATALYLPKFPHQDGFQSFNTGKGTNSFRYTILKAGDMTFLTFSDAQVRWAAEEIFFLADEVQPREPARDFQQAGGGG